MKLIPRGRTAKLVFLGLMVMAIATVGSYFAYYRLTHRPITFLPPVQAVTKRVPPRYVTSIYGVQAPLGVAAAGSRIYVAESKGDAIVRIFDTSGNEIGTLETPNVSSLDRRPCYVAVDSGGQVYVSDCRRLTVDMFSPQGQYVGALLPNGDVGYVWQPLALAFGPQGLLYVTDRTPGKHRLLALDPKQGWKVVLEVGKEGEGEAEFEYPNGVALAGDRIYVADSVTNRLQVFDKQGQYLAEMVGFSLPRGLLVDGMDRLHIVETTGQQVTVYEAKPDGKRLFSFGDEGTEGGQFLFPNAIAADSQGRLYITDRVNNRVQVWAY